MTPQVLLYATAGGAVQNIKLTDQVTGSEDSNTHLGWTAGVGADVKMTRHIFGRLEYRYTDFNSKDYTLNGLAHLGRRARSIASCSAWATSSDPDRPGNDRRKKRGRIDPAPFSNAGGPDRARSALTWVRAPC